MGLHQGEPSTRNGPSVRGPRFGGGKGAIRKIDRVLDLTTMAIARAGPVQCGRLCQRIGEHACRRALEGLRVEADELFDELIGGSHGRSLLCRRRAAQPAVAADGA
jgi:hypothetical protein